MDAPGVPAFRRGTLISDALVSLLTANLLTCTFGNEAVCRRLLANTPMKTTVRSINFCGASRRVSRTLGRLVFPLVAVLLCLPLTARAGRIDSVNSISGPGLGTVSVPLISTVNVNNDNQTGGGIADNNITVPIKRFDNIGYIDIEFNVSGTDGVTEYKVSESVDNDTGIFWNAYTMVLGFETGDDFYESPSGDGLDFDAPLYDLLPTSGAFGGVATSEDMLVFSGGLHNLALQLYTLRIDVPDDVVRFTLRQYPTAVPEPSTIALGVIALVGLAGLALRRKK
jgi:hypothetical protein